MSGRSVIICCNARSEGVKGTGRKSCFSKTEGGKETNLPLEPQIGCRSPVEKVEEGAWYTISD
jgi:hypothetical protein